MNQYLNALLGVKQNVRPSTAINIAKGVGMLARRSPHIMAASLVAYGGKKAYDYFTEDEEEAIEPTPGREDYLATLNNKFSDEELERFQTQMTQYDRGNHDKGNSSWYNLDYDSFN